MKRVFRLTTLVLAFLIVAAFFAGCGQTKTLSGTYTNGIDLTIVGTKVSYTFKGNNVTVTSTTTVFGNERTASWEGTYEIAENEDGTESITFEFKDDDASDYKGKFAFSKGEDAEGNEIIKIGLSQLTKKK